MGFSIYPDSSHEEKRVDLSRAPPPCLWRLDRKRALMLGGSLLDDDILWESKRFAVENHVKSVDHRMMLDDVG